MYVDSPEEIRASLEAARVAIAGQVRGLADEIETLPLDDAAEVITWIGGQIERLMDEGRPHPPRPAWPASDVNVLRSAGPLSVILPRDRERLGGDGREVGPEAEGNQVSDPGPNRSGRVAAVLSRHPTRGSASCTKNVARVFANPLRASPTAGPCPLRSVSAASPAR